MKLKFDHTHYVPILRWKRAERVALMTLPDDVRRRITPLLELVITKKNLASKISDDVRRQWGPSPFFLDDLNWPGAESGKVILSMVDAMRSHGLLAIPVTGLDRSRNQQTAVRRIVDKDRRGVCVRLCPQDLQTAALAQELGWIIGSFGCATRGNRSDS